jgi:hypothetical protein
MNRLQSRSDSRRPITLLLLKQIIPSLVFICMSVLLKRTLENYNRQKPAVQGQYLCHANGKPLTQYQSKHVLRKCLEYLGHHLNIF